MVTHLSTLVSRPLDLWLPHVMEASHGIDGLGNLLVNNDIGWWLVAGTSNVLPIKDGSNGAVIVVYNITGRHDKVMAIIWPITSLLYQPYSNSNSASSPPKLEYCSLIGLAIRRGYC